jgi:hypothetical protein
MDDVDRLRLTIRRSTAVVVFALFLLGVLVHDAVYAMNGYYPTDAPNLAYLVTMGLLVVVTAYLLFSPFVASAAAADDRQTSDDAGGATDEADD